MTAATAKGDITQALAELAATGPNGAARLFEVIYRELHHVAAAQMRSERVDHTLQATALVHEAYMRLLGGPPPKWESRAHFFAAAAEVMRRILIDHARQRGAIKRGGGHRRQELTDDIAPTLDRSEDLLAVDVALARMAETEPRKAQIVMLRFYAGLNLEQIAEVLEISVPTVKRDWRFARAWLSSLGAED